MGQIEKLLKNIATRGLNQPQPVQGTYRGQPVTVIPDNSPSIVQLSSSIAGFEATKQKIRAPIISRTIISKKNFCEKEKVLATYTERLGQHHQSKKYRETYSELSRLQYKPEYQTEDQQQQLCDTILYKIAENFGEVTEQDNVLEYALATNSIEQSCIETEISQVKKMIQFFEEPQKNTINVGFANMERLKWNEKLSTLEENLKTNATLKSQLVLAQQALQKIHKQEIRDGYNLIPKAAAIIAQQYGDRDGPETPVSLAISYRDEILTMTNPLEVFEVFIHRQEKKREEFRPYIDSMIALLGYDMTSSNPSRSKEELGGIRDGLFRIEICGQIFDSVGGLSRNIRRMFPNENLEPGNAENFTTKEQLIATRELVKLTQNAFASSQQISNLMDLFYPQCTQDLETAIFALNQTIELVRNLPGKFFKDDQSQPQFISIAQKKLDEFILQEQEIAGEIMMSGGNN